MNKKNKSSRIAILTSIALLVALNVIFTRFLGISTQYLRISMGMIPVAVAGMMFGPVWGGICGILGDVLGMIILPSGVFFPGFTVTAALTGIVYGFVLFGHPKSIVRLTIASVIVCIGLNLFLDTLWLNIMYSSGFVAILPERIIKCVLNIFIYTFLLHVIWNKVLIRIPAVRTLTEQAAL